MDDDINSPEGYAALCALAQANARDLLTLPRVSFKEFKAQAQVDHVAAESGLTAEQLAAPASRLDLLLLADVLGALSRRIAKLEAGAQ